MTMPTPLPFGLRDVKIYPYLDAQGTVLASTGFDLPNAQTFSFTETEEFVDLRGDDTLVASHGNGAQVNWSLEAGGISLQCWAVFTGGTILETGVAPNRLITLRKCSDDARPYFQVHGKVISDSGGDITGKVYRAKCNGDISGQFGDGAFFVTSADGIGLPIPGTKLLYDIIHAETKTFMTTTPPAIPVLPPKNVQVGAIATTTATAIWEPVTGATGYVVERAVSPFSTWVSAGADPTSPTLAMVGLTTATAYQLRVKTKIGTDTSYASVPIAFTTL